MKDAATKLECVVLQSPLHLWDRHTQLQKHVMKRVQAPGILALLRNTTVRLSNSP
jgi:hypothetical protein